MRAATAVIILKAACFVTVGFGTSLVNSLAQWADTGDWPPRINWVIVMVSGAVAAATQLLAFLSDSYAKYSNEQQKQTPPK